MQIVAEGLKKSYRIYKRQGLLRRSVLVKEALRGISFSMAQGELVGCIGPNGAGKSTMVKILSGVLVPDAGRCEVLGLTPWRERVRHVASIGVVFGQRSQLWWDLPVRDSFALIKDIYRLGARDYGQALDELRVRMGLDALLDIPVRQLSLGQRMRCELAASLLHRPRILFLDEPTIGLDAVTKLMVREFIAQINRERGTTVILTTHDMDDVEALCRRVLLVGDGQILLDGDISLLRAGSDERILNCVLGCDAQAVRIALPILEMRCERNRLTIRFRPEEVSAAALIAQLNEQYALRDVVVEHVPIERVVAARYKEIGGEGME